MWETFLVIAVLLSGVRPAQRGARNKLRKPLSKILNPRTPAPHWVGVRQQSLQCCPNYSEYSFMGPLSAALLGCTHESCVSFHCVCGSVYISLEGIL